MRECSARWAAVLTDDQGRLNDWQSALFALRHEMRELQLAGRWVRGSSDLLSIVGLNRWELAHSAALAWLLDPFGTHALGTAFLLRFATEVGADIAVDERIEVRVEESRCTSAGEVTRADVVVAGERWTLVLEVKVDAAEGLRQASRLYECWSVDPEPSFVFLTRTGHHPTTVDDLCRDAWTPLSWRWIAQALDEIVRSEAAPARALAEYTSTVKRMF